MEVIDEVAVAKIGERRGAYGANRGRVDQGKEAIVVEKVVARPGREYEFKWRSWFMTKTAYGYDIGLRRWTMTESA